MELCKMVGIIRYYIRFMQFSKNNFKTHMHAREAIGNFSLYPSRMKGHGSRVGQTIPWRRHGRPLELLFLYISAYAHTIHSPIRQSSCTMLRSQYLRKMKRSQSRGCTVMLFACMHASLHVLSISQSWELTWIGIKTETNDHFISTLKSPANKMLYPQSNWYPGDSGGTQCRKAEALTSKVDKDDACEGPGESEEISSYWGGHGYI